MPSMEHYHDSANLTDPADMMSHPVLGCDHMTYYIAIAAVLLVAFLLRPSREPVVSAPFYKASKLKWMFSAETLVRDSYGKFRDSVYRIKATEGVRVLIPVRLIGELKGLPEDTLSAVEAVNEAMLTEYTHFHLGRHNDTLSLLVRSKLTQRLTRLIPQLKSELEFITAEEFPDCTEWTPMKIHPFMLRVIARLSGRAFVGPELARSEEWMDTSTNFAIHAFIAVIKLQFFPPWLRPVAQYLVSELRQIQRDLAGGQAMLKPIINQRIQDDELDPTREKPDDFLQWLLDALPREEKSDYYIHTQLQLVLGAAAIHQTANLVTDCIYDLATHQYFQKELREEAYEVLELDDGWIRKQSMSKLKKMDSFIKESQRLSGNVTSFIRKVVKPIDLSDGTRLPKGTNLLAPQCGISHDERFFPNPDEFDGLRFYKMRQQSDEASNRWQFTSIGDTSLNFGLGKHACPGRFFASNEIKLCLAYLLLTYDIKLKDGEGRPEPMQFMMSKSPNTTAEILFRKRKSST